MYSVGQILISITKCHSVEVLLCQVKFKVWMWKPYASTICNPHTQKNISALEKIQNRGTRWVCGSRYNCHSHTWSKSFSHELHWPSLSIHRKYLTIVTIYDIYHCHISLGTIHNFQSLCKRTKSTLFSNSLPPSQSILYKC